MTLRPILLALLLLLCHSLTSLGQRNRIHDTEHIRSLQVVANGNPLLPPVLDMKAWKLEIAFDEMSHDYHRYRYHIEHCQADWTPSTQLFESNYLSGLNDQPIEDGIKSFNTMQLYTHYTLRLPNEDVRLCLSGNYRITLYDEDADVQHPIASVEFCLVEPLLNLSMTVDDNTDIDFQRSHQQVSVQCHYGALYVTDPLRDLTTYVIQNRRPDRRIQVQPNIRKANGCEFTHQRALIFPATNEYHKFEILDVKRVNLNVDHIRWYDPYYHATLDEQRPQTHYVYEADANGSFIINRDDWEEAATTSEYLYVHFTLRSDSLPGGPVYLMGNWCNEWPNEDYRMTYDPEDEAYHSTQFLKQGYYNYQYVQLQEDSSLRDSKHVTQPVAITDRTEGNFYQTHNEYQVLTYYKKPGDRYDRLVGYSIAGLAKTQGE